MRAGPPTYDGFGRSVGVGTQRSARAWTAIAVAGVAVGSLTLIPAGAQEQPPEPAMAPNIVVIITDDMRADQLDDMPATPG